MGCCRATHAFQLITNLRGTNVGRQNGSATRRLVALAFCLICSPGQGAGFAEAPGSGRVTSLEKWDVTQTRGKTRTIEFTTDEATFESVDISPDGKWVAFDLLGHIYRVSASGGKAECLTQASGAALNYHPRYSPDGRSIAFVSDRKGGQDNLWLMDADGQNPRPVFSDRGSRIRQPAWMPDGKTIVAVRVFPTVSDWESHRTTIAEFPLDGRSPRELLSSLEWQYYWPAPSPDGRYLYFYRSTMMRPLDNVTERQHLQRLELASGRVENITAPKRVPLYTGPDLAEFAPEVSPDGRWLAFARRIPGGTVEIRGHSYNVRTALWLRDLNSGTERIAMDPIESDSTQGNSARHMKALPGYRWARDSLSIVIPQGGKIRRLWLASGKIATIAFSATVRREISEAVRSRVVLGDGPFEPRFLRWPTSSPDGTHLVFEAVGLLWAMDLPHGKPRPLLGHGAPGGFQLTPSWSPDGRWIAYVTWDDVRRGHVWKVSAQGGSPQRLTNDPGEYLYPVWSQDSRTLLVTRGDGATARGQDWNDVVRWELSRIPAEGGSLTPIAASESLVRPSIAAGEIFYPELRTDRDLTAPSRSGEFEHLQWIMHVTTPKGADQTRFIITSSGPAPTSQGDWMATVAVSPRQDWVAFVNRFNVYLAPLSPKQEGGVVIGPNAPGVIRLTKQGGLYPSWRNAETLEFLSGNSYYAYHTNSRKTDAILVKPHVPRPTPVGTIALTGARIVTLERRQVLAQGTVLVQRGRITCVGECELPAHASVIDVSGKTIIPGLVDVHAHHLLGVGGVVSQHRSESARYLAHGVTTVLDPATWADPAFSIAELIAAGEIVGPRTYSVGNALAGFGGTSDIKNYGDAEDNVKRLVAWGAVSIKDYLQPSRVERQMLAQAARGSGVTITAEGMDLFHNLALVIDGHPGWEHNLPYTPLYQDAVRFFGQAGVVYSATLNVSSPAFRGQEYYFVRSDLLDDVKQQRFVPWRELITAKYFMFRPLADYSFPILAEGVADIVRAGGQAAIGGHGEWYGLDTHWDLWSEAMALSPTEALEVAAWKGASFVGLDKQLGSVAVGKAADLVVLNADPLQDIKNTINIRYVMKDGRLYDADTLDEIWPQPKPFGPRPWATEVNLSPSIR
jgi:Tol biopolymer transport system component